MSFQEYLREAIVDGEEIPNIPSPSEYYKKPVVAKIIARDPLKAGETKEYDVIGDGNHAWVVNQWYEYRDDKKQVQFVPKMFVDDYIPYDKTEIR